MKLRKILELALNEIGDSSQVPPGATFSVSDYESSIDFEFLDNKYNVYIQIIMKNNNKIAIAVDFAADADSGYSLTNKGQPLKVMSYIVGSIEEWANRYKSKVLRNNILELNYIKFDPKSEADEDSGPGNKRDKLYRMFIEKFAKKYGSSVTFSTTGGIIAQFKPPLEIK